MQIALTASAARCLNLASGSGVRRPATSGGSALATWMQRYLEAWDSHDPARVGAFVAEDATYEDLAVGQMHRGRAAIEAFVATSHEFSRDYGFVPISEAQSGDRYTLEWEMIGTNTDASAGMRATNKRYRIRGGPACGGPEDRREPRLLEPGRLAYAGGTDAGTGTLATCRSRSASLRRPWPAAGDAVGAGRARTFRQPRTAMTCVRCADGTCARSPGRP